MKTGQPIRDQLIGFKIDETGADWLRWRAKFEGLTVSQLIRAVMAGYCAYTLNHDMTDLEKEAYSAGQFVPSGADSERPA